MSSADQLPDLELARARFHLTGVFSDPDALERLARKTFDEWRLLVYERYEDQDVGVALHMEEGSLRGKALVLATLSAVFTGISNYGSIKAGLKELIEDGRWVSQQLFEKEPMVKVVRNDPSPKISWDAGTLEELGSIFERVKLAQLTPDEGVTLATALLSKYGHLSDQQRQELERSIIEMPKYGPQTVIPIEPTAEPKPKKSSKPRRETPDIPKQGHWVIDIIARNRRSDPEVKRRKLSK